MADLDVKLVSIEGAMKALSLGRTSIYWLRKSGDLHAITIGSRRLVTSESIDGFVKRMTDRDQTEPYRIRRVLESDA